ncbi:MAG: hypothetical protein GY816_12570 [Cytophagales bacterium]|nr:hypothetical protein [Cytophagales bacterium]
MRTIKSTLGAIAILISSSTFSQNNQVYFPYFELINLDESKDLQYSTSRLIKTYIETNHDYHILLPEKTDNYFDLNGYASAIEEAQNREAEFVMLGEIHSLDGDYIVSLGMYNSKTGKKLWHDLIKGVSQEDLDPLLSRLGRNFMKETKARDDVEIGEVTDYEQQGVALQQIKVNHFMGLMVGANTLIGDQTLSGFGLAYSYDANTVLFNVNFDFYPSSSVVINAELLEEKKQSANFNLGILYPLSRKRMTWFLSGGMEYGMVRIDAEGFELDPERVSGVGLFAGGGYLINRNSTVNLRIQAAISFPTYKIRDTYHPSLKFGIVTSFTK